MMLQVVAIKDPILVLCLSHFADRACFSPQAEDVQWVGGEVPGWDPQSRGARRPSWERSWRETTRTRDQN